MLALSKLFKVKKLFQNSSVYLLAHVLEDVLKESANAPIQAEIVDRARLTDQWPQVGRRGRRGFRFRRFRRLARSEKHDHSCTNHRRLLEGHVLRPAFIVAGVRRFHTTDLQLGELSVWSKAGEKDKSKKLNFKVN